MSGITMKKFSIHYSFFLLILMGILIGLIKEISQMIMVILIHEIGHLVFIKLFKFKLEKINIYPFGGVINYNMKNDFLYKSFFITIGGILFNLIFFFIFKLLNFKLLAELNMYFILLNLIPLFPLDGGRVLLLFLSNFFPYRISKIFTHLISCVVSFFLIIYLSINFNGIYYLLFLFICIRLNILSLIFLKREYQMFLIVKHLNPNNKLKNKITKFWTKNPLLCLYDGKNTVYDFETFKVKEEVILKKYFEK